MTNKEKTVYQGILPEIIITADKDTGKIYNSNVPYIAVNKNVEDKGKQLYHQGMQRFWEESPVKPEDIAFGMLGLGPAGKAINNTVGWVLNKTAANLTKFRIPIISKLKTKYNNFFYPYKMKRLDELRHYRQFKKENPYEYVTDRQLLKEVSNSADGTNLYRAVRPKAIGINDTNVNSPTAMHELLLLKNKSIPERVTWASTTPDEYIIKPIRNYKKYPSEIHIQPKKDFSFQTEQPRNLAGAINGWDWRSRIVNADGFNFNSGKHFIRIPGANRYAVMRPRVKYNTAPAYTSPLPEETIINPYIKIDRTGLHIDDNMYISTPFLVGVSSFPVGFLGYNSYQHYKRKQKKNDDKMTKNIVKTAVGLGALGGLEQRYNR